ncbi:MAG TPA: porin [Burkholderiaceae bacterium]
MKKSLLCLAVLSAFIGSAYADTSVQVLGADLTIYGVLDAGISHEKNGNPAGSVTRLESGIQSGTRFGFKGERKLEGDTSVIFQLESGFDISTGALGQGGVFFGRQAYVGFKNSLGTVAAGRQLTPVFQNSSTFDPFGDGLAGDSARMFNYAGSRTDKILSYGLEKNGFRGQLQYGVGGVAGNASAGSTVAGFGGYKVGPLDAVLTYETKKNALGVNIGRTTLLGSNYDFRVLKVFGAYALDKNVLASGVDTREALLGLSVPIGTAGTFLISDIKKWNKTTNNADANQIALGYLHQIYPSTNLYTSVSRTTNNSAASYNVVSAGATDTLIDVGFRFKF